jgi:hypothetical protein
MNPVPMSPVAMSPVSMSPVAMSPVPVSPLPAVDHVPIADPEPSEIDRLNFIFNSEIIPVTLLKRQPIDVWKSLQFNVHQFVDEMRSIPNLQMNDYDKTNFGILLFAEETTAPTSEMMSTNSLHEFGIRFGSWIKIVEKVRDFVSAGAKDWFFGKCSSTEAKMILENYGPEHEYYLIRSVPVAHTAIPGHNLRYVFAISSRNSSGHIAHMKIYKDSHDRLCMINDDLEIEFFSGFKELIFSIVNNGVPASNPLLIKGLQRQPPVIVFKPDPDIIYVPKPSKVEDTKKQ